MTADIVALACQYGRYGCRTIAELLRTWAGWVVNDKRVERIWRQERLKVPAKPLKRVRLWLADGSCERLLATHCDHLWSYRGGSGPRRRLDRDTLSDKSIVFGSFGQLGM